MEEILQRRTLLTRLTATAGWLAAGQGLAHPPKAMLQYNLPEAMLPKYVSYFSPAYEIHVDPDQFALYWTLPNNRALRYVVGVGRPGLYEAGEFFMGAKKRMAQLDPDARNDPSRTEEIREIQERAARRVEQSPPVPDSSPRGSFHSSALRLQAVMRRAKGVLHRRVSDTNRYKNHGLVSGHSIDLPVLEGGLSSQNRKDIEARAGYGRTWTPSVIERDPTLPRYMPPGPDNPLGIRAMHLSWQYYRIHGTNDTRKIGRKSSNGCIGLYNEQIVEVFDRTPVGTQVKLI